MGSRGPKTLPANVHMLRGNPSKKPLASLLDDVVRPDVEVPKCPEWLSVDAKAEWRRITKLLVPLGLISQIDRATLTAYCTAWGDLAWAERQIAQASEEDGGGRISKIAAGTPKLSAVMNLKYQSMEKLVRFGTEFGMSPAARSRVTASDPQLSLPGVDDKPQEPTAPIEWGGFK